MESAVTQKDFELFKQEMKSEYKLFTTQLDKNISDIIDKKLAVIIKWVIGVITVFVVAFSTYFEWTHNSINEINHKRAVLNLEESIKEVLKKQSEAYKIQMEKMGVKVLMGKEAIESLENSDVYVKQKKPSNRKKKGS